VVLRGSSVTNGHAERNKIQKGANMKVVKVRGADGSERDLALVKVENGHAHVCPLDKAEAVEAGDDQSVVVFPITDVRDAA
jgi:hypothetical protein